MSMKKIAMIPVRSGSKRIKNKNLRLIAGKPLIEYILRAVIKSGQFELNEIYINSNSSEYKIIADQFGVNFYQRSEWCASDEATNDDFVNEFLDNINCDFLFQFLATSPFVTSEQVDQFVNSMVNNELDTLISVTPQKIECVFQGLPVNFIATENTPPSQLLTPVYSYACGLMAWRVSRYVDNMKKFNSAYHGGEGRTDYFELTGFSSIDIDTEEDFALAEMIAASLNNPFETEAAYFDPYLHSQVYTEEDVPSIVAGDGVGHSEYSESNQSVRNITDILAGKDTPSWIHRVIDSESNSACLICQQPGEGNRRHYHPSWNEWWYIVKGEWDFDIEGEVSRVKKGDFVFIPKNNWHKITAVGDEPAIRLAVSREGVEHVYRDEMKAYS